MTLEVVSEVLKSRRIKGWLVGGTVRDRELGRHSPDLDLVGAADAATAAREIARVLDAPWFALSERHGACRVMARTGHVDVAALRGDGIADDLAQRDFTVNAMAVPFEGGAIVDPFRGLAHLRQSRLVAVSQSIFRDDPLRLMRAPRFAHNLGLEPDAALVRAVQSEASLIVCAAGERVTTEMALTLSAGRSAEAVRRWRDLGLLEVVLPEVAADEKLAPALALLERLDELLSSPTEWFLTSRRSLTERLATPVDGVMSRPVALRMAGLLHRSTVSENLGIARRLKLSRPMHGLLQTVTGYFGGGPGRGLSVSPSGRPGVLFLWEVAPWEPEVIMLAAAGPAAPARENGSAALGSSLECARSLMGLWSERAAGRVSSPPLDGTVLMEELGLAPGPLLGRLVREVRLAWEAGEVRSRDGLLAVARGALEADREEAGQEQEEESPDTSGDSSGTRSAG